MSTSTVFDLTHASMSVSDLSRIIQSYACFERKVHAVVKEFCAPYCTLCKGVCCSPDYCRETHESPFLCLVRQAYPPGARYTETDGWLTESGCALTVGRAPVCYEFLCDRILNAGIGQTALYVLTVLSHLITHAGRIGPARRHVVELMRMKDLEKLTFARFEKRLAESEKALAVIRSFQKKKPIPENSLALLTIILRPTNLTPAVAEPYAVSAV